MNQVGKGWALALGISALIWGAGADANNGEDRALEGAPPSQLERLALELGLQWVQRDLGLWSARVEGFAEADGSVDERVRAALLLSVACHADNKALAEGADGWYLGLLDPPGKGVDPASFLLLLVDRAEPPPATGRWGMRHLSGALQGDCG
ncbi:hypothetical protein [Aestuariirhabdus litorea]|uniref:Uncharacterized protein n=1 Tax=Aestuariirhabdus litorea TaxID=2528527 RepID=A0A3P3VSA6_9GAMM|nr:hypothetical protein [Aestuariirhabdus litorea]RRJ84389.1 hypothetical protein D0544_04585 [Aestuariirhabdus litorea]RWW97614.1 hypothetical protein DZC74_04580 [Endozoicomonadaceae bacterium GTF-13]